jgi:hypothetical protein
VDSREQNLANNRTVLAGVQLPWRDFTWFGDATLAIVYRALGLSAVPALWMVYRVGLAAITFFLASGSRDRLWIPLIISRLAQYLLYGVGPVGVRTSATFFGRVAGIAPQSKRWKIAAIVLAAPVVSVLGEPRSLLRVVVRPLAYSCGLFLFLVFDQHNAQFICSQF